MRGLWLSNFVTIGLCSWLAAASVSDVIRGELAVVPQSVTTPRPRPRPVRRAPRDLSMLSERNLLGAKREDLTAPVLPAVVPEPEPDAATEMPPDDELQECSLPGVFVAVVEAREDDWSFALYRPGRRKRPTLVTLDEDDNTIEAREPATLVDIRPRAVVVQRDDRYELCELGVKGNKRKVPPRRTQQRTSRRINPAAVTTVRKVSADHFEIERGEVERLMGNLSQVSRQARFIPHFVHGKADGFKLLSIRPGSIFGSIGLRNGDIVNKVNGYALDSLDQAASLLQKVRGASSLALDITRRGRKRSLAITVR